MGIFTLSESSRMMDKLSRKILGLIQKKPTETLLTSVAMYYIPGSPIGRGGVDSATKHKGKPCPCERNHKGQKAAKQKQENIAYNVNGHYTFEVGK